MQQKADKSDVKVPVLLSEDRLYGLPQRSDAEFLVQLRRKLSRQNTGIWIPHGRLAFMAGVAVLLVVGVWLPSNSYQELTSKQVEQSVLSEAVTDFIETDADPLELAEYLGVPESTDTTTVSGQEDSHMVDLEEVESSPELDTSTDDLLELDEPDLELVLSDIRDTEFF